MRITIEHQYERKNGAEAEAIPTTFRLEADDGSCVGPVDAWVGKMIFALKEAGIPPFCEVDKGGSEIANLKGQLERKSKVVEELKGYVAEIEAQKVKLQADIDRLLVANGKLEQQLKETHGIMRATDARLEVQLKRNRQLADENAKLKQAIFKVSVIRSGNGFFATSAPGGHFGKLHQTREACESAILKQIGINQ